MLYILQRSKTSQKKRYLWYDSKLHLIVWPQFWKSGDCGVAFHGHYSQVNFNCISCWRRKTSQKEVSWVCSGREISYFNLARKFNSTLNFTQSGWPIRFIPDLHFRPANWVSCQTQFLWLENAVQCRRHIGRSSIAIATLFSWTTPPSADVSLGALK